MLYRFTLLYIRIALRFFYKQIIISQKEAIPTDKPVLYIANHQNAMLDPLLVAITAPRPIYFLARAAAFKNALGAYFLKKLHAIAIYRVRDGVDSRAMNEAVFSHCLSLFNKNEQILIFPEGNHNIKRQIRPLRLGFTRLTLDYLQTHPQNEFYIVPIGLNYTDITAFDSYVHVIYGKPILANDLVDLSNLNESRKQLIDTVTAQLQTLTVHIPDENYDAVHKRLETSDFLHPHTANKKIQKASFLTKSPLKKLVYKKNFFYYLMQLNSIFPFLIWKWIKPKIASVEFLSTFKFALGISVFPLFYVLQSLLVYHFTTIYYALIYFVFSIVLVRLSALYK